MCYSPALGSGCVVPARMQPAIQAMPVTPSANRPSGAMTSPEDAHVNNKQHEYIITRLPHREGNDDFLRCPRLQGETKHTHQRPLEQILWRQEEGLPGFHTGHACLWLHHVAFGSAPWQAGFKGLTS